MHNSTCNTVCKIQTCCPAAAAQVLHNTEKCQNSVDAQEKYVSSAKAPRHVCLYVQRSMLCQRWISSAGVAAKHLCRLLDWPAAVSHTVLACYVATAMHSSGCSSCNRILTSQKLCSAHNCKPTSETRKRASMCMHASHDRAVMPQRLGAVLKHAAAKMRICSVLFDRHSGMPASTAKPTCQARDNSKPSFSASQAKLVTLCKPEIKAWSRPLQASPLKSYRALALSHSAANQNAKLAQRGCSASQSAALCCKHHRC
jgi:hypothetical protein